MSRCNFMKAVILCSLFSVTCFASYASADPVRVTSGGYSEDYGDGAIPWVFAGDGFRLELTVRSADTLYWGPVQSCLWLFDPCTPSIDLGTRLIGINGNGDTSQGYFGAVRPAQIGDTSYPALYYSGDLILDAPTIPPRAGLIDEPFAFSGHLRAFTNPNRTGIPVFDSDLRGRGTARIAFGGPPNGRPEGIYMYGLLYTFANDAAQTPEPGTMMLVGSMLAAGYVRRRHRQQSSRL